MRKKEFILIESGFSNAQDVPKGKNIFYRCLKCGEMIRMPSMKDQVGGCSCGNIHIDTIYLRFIVKDSNQFEVLEKV